MSRTKDGIEIKASGPLLDFISHGPTPRWVREFWGADGDFRFLPNRSGPVSDQDLEEGYYRDETAGGSGEHDVRTTLPQERNEMTGRDDVVKQVAEQAVADLVDVSLAHQAEALREAAAGDAKDSAHHAEIAQGHLDTGQRIADTYLKKE